MRDPYGAWQQLARTKAQEFDERERKERDADYRRRHVSSDDHGVIYKTYETPPPQQQQINDLEPAVQARWDAWWYEKYDREWEEALALLWQIWSGKGFPNQFSVTHGWSAIGGADHGLQRIGLGRRAWTFSQAVSGSVRSQGAAANVSALRIWADRPWRSQEHSADG